MAAKNCAIILGFVDEQVTSRTQNLVDNTTNKIGGLPDWTTKATIPICKKCGRKQSFVLQIYAPLEGSLYHRTLYIFACVTQECWNRPHSWTCLRSQVLDPNYTSKPLPTKTTAVANIKDEKWFDDEDDWGDNDNDGNGNTDNFSFNCSPKLSYLDNVTKNGGNLNNINANASHSINSVVRSMECKLNLNEGDGNANDALCGAVGMLSAGETVGEEASAIIEDPEGDMIALDTPERPSTDIPALFKEAFKIDANVDAVFLSYFVSTGLEPPENTDFTEHERDLLLRYTHNTGHELQDDDMCMDTKGCGDAVYEKDTVVHGDTYIHKFNKRVSREPSQILRYCRDESYIPLWLYEPSPGDFGGKCSYCKSSLTFEAQVMPQLVNFLRLSGIKDVALEFGTVLLYTCSSSCWNEGDAMRQEVAIVQCEVI